MAKASRSSLFLSVSTGFDALEWRIAKPLFFTRYWNVLLGISKHPAADLTVDRFQGGIATNLAWSRSTLWTGFLPHLVLFVVRSRRPVIRPFNALRHIRHTVAVCTENSEAKMGTMPVGRRPSLAWSINCPAKRYRSDSTRYLRLFLTDASVIAIVAPVPVIILYYSPINGPFSGYDCKINGI